MLSHTRVEPILLVARMYRLPAYLVACVGLIVVTPLIPAVTGLPLRELTMSPWQTLCGVLGVVLTFSLDERYCVVQLALPRALWQQRLLVMVMALMPAVTAVAVSAAIADRPWLSGVTTLALVVALTLAVSAVSGVVVATLATFVLVLINWVFGLAADGVQIRVWALLVMPVRAPLVVAASVALGLGLLLWVRRGSASS